MTTGNRRKAKRAHRSAHPHTPILPYPFAPATLAAFATLVFLAGVASAQSTPLDPRFGAVEAFRAPVDAAELRLGWERVIFFWNQLQPHGPNEWNDFHFEEGWLADATAHGRQIVGLLEGTPAWATDGSPNSGVPRGLYAPIDDPANLWAEFVRTIVRRYAGRIDHWIIWNEPDIEPPEYGVQWEGAVADYAQLLKVAYLAARQENPNVVIHFAGLTYWHDVVNRRALYLQRYLDEARKDPAAAGHNYYFDAVTLHIYFTTDSVYDITAEFAAVLRRNGLAQPIWINETNAPPFDDPLNPWTIPDWRVTLDQQAGFVVQAFAQGLAAGAQRIAVYKLVDFPPYAAGYEPYGLVRSDGTRRPAFEAMRVVTTYFAGAQSARIDRTAARSIVTLERGAQTTRVLWARGKTSVPLSLAALAPQATLVTHLGATQIITPTAGVYRLTLPAALCADPVHGCAVGGAPLVIVEDAPAGAAPQATADATPGASASAAHSTPPPTPTLTLTPTPTPTPTLTLTSTPSPTLTYTPTPTASATPPTSPLPPASPAPSQTPAASAQSAQDFSSVSPLILLALALGAILVTWGLNRRGRRSS